MNTHRAELVHNGTEARLTIDGHDISHAVRRATWDASAGQYPLLRLDMQLQEGRLESGEPLVVIPSATADALVLLGWTPPSPPDDVQP